MEKMLFYQSCWERIVFKKQINTSAFRKIKKQLTKDRRYDKVSKSSTKRQQDLNSKMFDSFTQDNRLAISRFYCFWFV